MAPLGSDAAAILLRWSVGCGYSISEQFMPPAVSCAAKLLARRVQSFSLKFRDKIPIGDRSSTEEELRTIHEALLADKTQMHKLKDAGIAPPDKMEYKPRRYVSDYKFRNVRFDDEIELLAAP